MACAQSMIDYGKARPFGYVTARGEPPEIEAPPFKDMPVTGFIADSDPAVLARLITLPRMRALEIRRQRVPPVGYRVRMFHEGAAPPDFGLLIHPDEMYDMAQAQDKGTRSRAQSKASRK